MGPTVLGPQKKTYKFREGPYKRAACHLCLRQVHSFSPDLKDVVLGGGIDAQMKHGLSGHLETIL